MFIIQYTYGEEKKPEPVQQPAPTEKPESTTAPASPPTANNTASSAADDGTNTNTEKNIKPPSDIFTQFNSDFSHYVTNVEPLLVGSQTYQTLFKASTTVNNKGVMILIPDWQQPATAPQTMAYLTNNLPEHGWATLTIQPPAKPNNYPSMALKEADRKKENEETIKAYQKKLALLCQALADKAAKQPGIMVLISEGNHASLLLEAFQKITSNRPSAIIMLSAHRETEQEEILSASLIGKSNTPILDLYLEKDHHQVSYAIKLRKQQANKALKVIYRQKQLQNFETAFYPPETLLKEIQGWLKSIGW